MKIYFAQSTNPNPKIAVAELKSKFNAPNINGINFFASYIYNPDELIAAMNENFPNIQVFGCSSMVELINGKISYNSLIAIAFTDEVLESVTVGSFGELETNLNSKIQNMLESFEKHYEMKSFDMDFRKFFGISYFDSNSKKDEEILDFLGNVTNIGCVGGNASDNMKFERSIIYANGRYYINNGAACVLLKSKVKFGIEKIQNVISTGKKLVPTKVNEATRTIYEFNGKPAAQVYSELVGVPIEKLNEHFPKNPLALMIDGSPFLRDLHSVGPNLEVQCFCGIKQGIELEIMQPSDIIETTKSALAAIKKKYNSIAGILGFDCAYRYFEIKNAERDLSAEYGKLFADLPFMSFYTFGESYIGHLNHTLTMVVLEEN